MEKQGLQHRVYAKNVVEFVTVANEFCHFVENCETFSRKELIRRLQMMLPLLYLKAAMVGRVESTLQEGVESYVTELDYNVLREKWSRMLERFDAYLEIFKPEMQFSEEPLEASISENIADIYQDLKNFCVNYGVGDEDIMQEALYSTLFNFETGWGQQLVNMLRAVHNLTYGADDLNEEQTHDEENVQEKVVPGWLKEKYKQ